MRCNINTSFSIWIATDAFGNALGDSIAGQIGQGSQQTTALKAAEAEESVGSYWDTHPMLYASNDMADPSQPVTMSDAGGDGSRLIVSMGSPNGADESQVPSAALKFVQDYTAQHPDASYDEVQSAYDSAWADQSDAHFRSSAKGAVFGAWIGGAAGAETVDSLPTADYLSETVKLRESLLGKADLFKFYNTPGGSFPEALSGVPENLYSDYGKRVSIYLKGMQDAARRFPMPGEDAPVEAFKQVMEQRSPLRPLLLTETRDQLSQSGLDFSEAIKPRGGLPDYLDKYRRQVIAEANMSGESYGNNDPINVLKETHQKEIYRRTAEGAVTSNDGFTIAAQEAVKLRGKLQVADVISKAGKYGGGTLAVLGAGLDGYSFGTELNKSMQSGNYSNTVNEGVRIAGGWAGAAALATPFAAQGAAWGSVGGPIGTAAGGVVGGLVGGGLGYFGGSQTATKVWSGVQSGWNSFSTWLRK